MTDDEFKTEMKRLQADADKHAALRAAYIVQQRCRSEIVIAFGGGMFLGVLLMAAVALRW